MQAAAPIQRESKRGLCGPAPVGLRHSGLQLFLYSGDKLRGLTQGPPLVRVEIVGIDVGEDRVQSLTQINQGIPTIRFLVSFGGGDEIGYRYPTLQES